jgi:hypothetical protein
LHEFCLLHIKVAENSQAGNTKEKKLVAKLNEEWTIQLTDLISGSKFNPKTLEYLLRDQPAPKASKALANLAPYCPAEHVVFFTDALFHRLVRWSARNADEATVLFNAFADILPRFKEITGEGYGSTDESISKFNHECWDKALDEPSRFMQEIMGKIIRVIDRHNPTPFLQALQRVHSEGSIAYVFRELIRTSNVGSSPNLPKLQPQ